MATQEEIDAATPEPLDGSCFNANSNLPHGLTTEEVAKAMEDFVDFIASINQALVSKDLPRLESVAMPANFSSLVGEFMHRQIPEYSSGLVQNQYHNGHPDMVPTGMYSGDSVQYGDHGIEVKASRYRSGWQGHNVEQCWLMVFHYDSNSPNDEEPIRPFKFKGVFVAELEEDDWSYSGRDADSRRTITASVLASGRDKMLDNYVYDVERCASQPQLSMFKDGH
jgi:hypothetical protein